MIFYFSSSIKSEIKSFQYVDGDFNKFFHVQMNYIQFANLQDINKFLYVDIKFIDGNLS